MNKSRHLLLTIYLIFLIISSLGPSIISLIFYDELVELIPQLTKRLMYISLFSTLIEVFSIYLIFKWMKIGFYGIIAAYFINLYIADKSGILDINTILGIGIRIGLLYGFLQIKSKGVSGWKNLID